MQRLNARIDNNEAVARESAEKSAEIERLKSQLQTLQSLMDQVGIIIQSLNGTYQIRWL